MAAAMVRVRRRSASVAAGSPALPHDRYSPGTPASTRRRLRDLPAGSGAGFPMIAGSDLPGARAPASGSRVAARRGVHFSIVDCNADVATLRERITARARRRRATRPTPTFRCWSGSGARKAIGQRRMGPCGADCGRRSNRLKQVAGIDAGPGAKRSPKRYR
ncbi:hypothetical protein ACU4GD_16745 [Cupriavidus basilensis]